MKIILVFDIAILILLISCSSLMKDKIKEFIPGTYIRFSQQEFGAEYDTLIITLQNPSANEYNILRKWKYERVLDGNELQPEYKRIRSSGIYLSKHKIIQETETGDVISFDIKHKILFNGSVQYHKL